MEGYQKKQAGYSPASIGYQGMVSYASASVNSGYKPPFAPASADIYSRPGGQKFPSSPASYGFKPPAYTPSFPVHPVLQYEDIVKKNSFLK